MAVILGEVVYPFPDQLTRDNYYLADELDTLQVDYWFPHHNLDGVLVSTLTETVGKNLPVETITFSILAQGNSVNYWFDDYYNRVHTLPSNLNFGNILTDQVLTVEVFSAIFVSNPLSSILAVNLDNVNITNALGLLTYKPLESRIYSITASKNGAAILNGGFTFSFAITPAFLPVTGQRVVFFPFIPHTEYTESREYLTDIIQSISGETSLELREAPRQRLNFNYYFKSLAEYSLAKNLIKSYSHIGLATPLWAQIKPINALAINITTITINTTNLDIAIGNIAVVFLNYTKYEIVEISAFTSTTVDLKLPLTQSFPKCFFIPVKIGINEREVSFKRQKASVNFLDMEFLIPDGFYSASFAGYEMFNSLPVVSKATIVSGSLTENIKRDQNILTNDVGNITIIENENYTRLYSTVAFKAKGQTEIYALKRFLDYLNGRSGYFYLPSFSLDAIPVTNSLAAGVNTIVINYTGFTLAPPKYIRVIGNITVNFTVLSVAASGVNTETITLSTNNPTVISNITSIQILTKMRSASDNLEIKYNASEARSFDAFTSFPVVEVN